jgi:hypothetical protein
MVRSDSANEEASGGFDDLGLLCHPQLIQPLDIFRAVPARKRLPRRFFARPLTPSGRDAKSLRHKSVPFDRYFQRFDRPRHQILADRAQRDLVCDSADTPAGRSVTQNPHHTSLRLRLTILSNSPSKSGWDEPVEVEIRIREMTGSRKSSRSALTK